ncbi:tetratricopeptide repeat protein [Olleya sp. HaHaR_3_96]|uniref:tetratricopeptide repeat protein n=1 Tax=Olleya sp. HaHaR_3_96 TaxID=2745560 RepID=UPI001C4E62A0|nr:cell surface protein [Olleya sp. HaHaR_3_96]QXP59607.1 cell surface protein [Olleya sp. HaHaR_3_96]
MNTKLYMLLLVIIMATSCSEKTKTITNPEDYNKYLTTETSKETLSASTEYNFWNNKLEATPNQISYLSKIASAESRLFKSTGYIKYLKQAEQALVRLNEETQYSSAGHLRALARNYISQHKFKDALQLVEKAENNGQNLDGTQKMMFDVHMELGNYVLAKNYLEKVKDLNDFGYLIRLSKWSDYKGDLASAIKYLEKATKKAEASKLEGLMEWSYTNLADFYGHDGQVEKSYNYYLKSLAINPDDAYAKKGIAWIVYSYEKNTTEANRILEALTQLHNAPDYLLFKAEIAEYDNNEVAKKAYLNSYFEVLEDTNYGDMYNVYSSKILADAKSKTAITLAKIEVQNRPTPISYDLLAWSYFNNGNTVKALNIAEQYVVGKTFEPEAQYHIAEIYKANGKFKDVAQLKKELQNSSYELGPLTFKSVNKL